MVDGPSLQGPRTNNNPDPISDLVKRLTSLRQDLNDVTSAILKSAGIEVTPDTMTITRALDVLGELNVGGQLNVTGDALFSGNLAVPNGSITNAALQSPVVPAAFSASGSAFATADFVWETFASIDVIVPAGFTKAVFQANAFGKVTNTTPSYTGFMQARAVAAGSIGDAGVSGLYPTEGFGTATSLLSSLFTGLTGGSAITVSCQIATTEPWDARAGNFARISGTVLWFR